MRKNIFNLAINIIGIFVLSILLLTCIDGRPDKAVVSFFITDSKARTVFPDVLLEDVVLYRLLGGRNNELETELLEFTAESTSILLEAGIWNFTLNAYDENDKLILHGSVQNQQINLTGTNQVSFTLSPINNGTGNMQITLNFPEEADITRISANGDITSEDFNDLNSNNFTYAKSNIESGDYFINFDLYTGNILRTTVSELVLVRYNLTSNKIITLTMDNIKPLLTGVVNIVGTAFVGEKLTADTSDLNGTGNISYQWIRGDTDINGANESVYTVHDDDIGEVITVVVTCEGYVGDVTSEPTEIVPPVLDGTVSIDGIAYVGQTLTADTSALNGTGDIFYQWKRGTVDINNATDSIYTIHDDDLGSNISVTVTRLGFSGSVTSIPTPSIILTPLTGTVSITGTVHVGQILTADITNLGGSGTITYQWRRGSTNIGSNSSTYTVQSADVGSAITVTVTRAGNSGSVTSNPTDNSSLPPITGTVSITGDAIVGQTLTANITSLGGSGTISYQWRRGTTNIGTNSNTYSVVAADIGSTITVTVTRADNSGSVTSTATTAVPLGPVTITGTVRVGQVLTANIDYLGGTGTLSYQWRRGTTNIGTNSSTYTVQHADAGSAISVTVTRGSLGSVTSSVTITVPQPAVSISGTAQVGSTLTANVTNLGGTLSYQWRRGTTNIGTGSTYTVQFADVGSTINVVVTVSGIAGNVTSTSTTSIPQPTATFNNVVSNGGVLTQASTQLTLTFNRAITGLTADDIILSGISNVSKGILSGTGPTYTLPISGFTDGGILNVLVSKSGWDISNSTRTVTIYSGSLTEKLLWLQTNAQSGGNYTLEVRFDENISPQNLFYSGRNNITINLIGIDTNRTITLSSNGSIFTIDSGVKLTLGNNITLNGRNNNSSSLITVNTGGELIMNTGSILKGNNMTGDRLYGGGVNVNGGIFTMHDGEISNNTLRHNNWPSYSTGSYGGGVYVRSGSFVMEGGRITGNTVGNSSDDVNNNGSGGGVYIFSGSSFIMNGGEISNNIASGSGGGVVISGSSFTMNGGSIFGNTVNLIYEESSMRGGGGVSISSGTFIMRGSASIYSNNSTNPGGGVHVGGQSTFTMQDNSSVYGNSTTSRGGGIYVGTNNTNNPGIFRISSGIVYGNNETTVSLRNTGVGAALFVINNGTATFGVDGTGNNILPSGTTSRSNTIKVLNGVLQ